MKRTFCTVIRDEDAEAALGPMAEALAPARHWAFREIHIRKRPLKDVKREALTKFGITARHFNGIRYELAQAVNAWAGGLKYRRDNLRERIKDLTKQISGIQKKLADPKKELTRRNRRQLRFSLHQKKRHLGIQKQNSMLWSEIFRGTRGSASAAGISSVGTARRRG